MCFVHITTAQVELDGDTTYKIIVTDPNNAENKKEYTVPFTVTASSPKLFSVPFLSIISVYSLSFSFAVTYIFTIVCSFSVDIIFVVTFVSIPKLFICTSAVLYKLVAHISDVSWSASIIALYVSLLIFVASTPSTFTL